jgi:hypothetical protein
MLSVAHAQTKTKPAPSDLNKQPLVPADAAELPAGTERVDIFLLMGQSNMKGRGVMLKEPLRDPQIIMMHLKTDGWFLARHPLHLIGDPKTFEGADNAGVGPGLSFAQTLAKAQPKTRIALIPCAKGGSNITQWRKGRQLYDETERRAKLALSHGPKGKTRIAGALWLQGESDTRSDESIEKCRTSIGTLIDNLRADLGIKNLPFIACTIGEKKTPELRRKMNAVLLDLPNIRPHTACADGRSFAGFVDAVHFDTTTQDKHGRLYAEEYLKLSK